MEQEAAIILQTDNDESETYQQQLRKDEMNEALRKICTEHKPWLYFIFILSVFPGILNGMHLISYVFYVDNEPFYCVIPELENAEWTSSQIMNVSLPNIQNTNFGCEFYDYNYLALAKIPYQNAVEIAKQTRNSTRLLPCQEFRYTHNNSVIYEWDLVCDRFIYRSNINAAYAIGKFFGASFFGTISDKYGRKFSFTMASLSYVASTLLVPFSSAYGIFLLSRFFIGVSGVGCYGTIYTLLSEILTEPAKTWICCSFNLSYPLGSIILTFIAYHVQHWKSLQIIMSIPTIIFPFYYWILPESPQWLLTNNKFDEAWRVVQNIDPTIQPSCKGPKISEQKQPNNTGLFATINKLVAPFVKFALLFSTSALALRAGVCFFSWFTVSSTYFGLAMNNQNFSVNPYLYTTLNGILEIISNILPIYILSVCGRKKASITLYAMAGVSLLSIMFLPKSSTTIILIVALFGRFCDSAVYIIITLYTSELFPTSIRNTAIGASSTMSHLGTFVSPYITDLLGAYWWHIPSTIFGSLCLLTIFLIALLPETRNKTAYNTIEEMTNAKRTKELLNKRQTNL